VPTTTTVGAPQECTAGISTQLPESQTGHPVWVYGDEIGEARMTALWEYASSHAPRDFGRLIGSGQGWFGSCRYPGVGLGTGSGYSWHDRNVVLWVWSDEVDLALARRTLLDFVDSLVPVVGSTTTTAPTIATTTSTTVPGTPESTTTTIDPGVPVAGQVNLQSVAAPEPVAAGAVVKSAVSRAGVATPSVARKVTVKSRVRNAPAKDSRRATGKAPVKVSPRHHR
jgi:hypothetical protein